jgi:prepilin-type N-terminal cleavage/methylation domain-containing protein
MMMDGRRRKTCGHSLIELLTAIVIVVILSSIAVAAYIWAIPWVKEKLGSGSIR